MHAATPRQRGRPWLVSGTAALVASLSLLTAMQSADGAPATHSGVPTPPLSAGDGTTASATGAPDVVEPEWVPTIDQDFSIPAALGEFSAVYPGWASYDGFRDTTGRGSYDSDRVVSVSEGILTEHVHTADGQALVVSITPVPHVQTYGRYEVRFRADVIPGYKIAWLLWPADDDWANGEIDFPEAILDPGAGIQGFSHQVRGGDPSINQWFVDHDASPQTWHTAVIEWRPGSLTYALDGVAQTTTDPVAIPTTPMYWSMQTETNGDPHPESSGAIQIDHVRAWAYSPPGTD